MKKLSLLILMLAMTGLASAITPTDSQMWWGYFSETNANNLPYDGNLGYSRACTIDAAIYVPANDAFVGSSTIRAIRFWLGYGVTAISSDVQVWISRKSPTNVSSSDYVQTVPRSSLASGLNEVELNTPFDVNGQGIYVGFTFSTSGRTFPVMSYGSDLPNAFFYRVDNGNWEDFYGEEYGRLALQLLIDGGDFPTNSVIAQDFGQNVVLKGQSKYIPVTFVNTGKDPVTSISYIISTEGGTTTPEATISVNPIPLYGTYTAQIPFPSDNETRKYQKSLSVTRVNGAENTSLAEKGTGTLITIAEILPVLPVVEEFTGTWCGYCPYGIVGMQKAHETYGDQVVLIAAHSGDPMECAGYADITNTVSSYPSAFMNRETDFYPSSYTILNEIHSSLNRAVQGKVSLTAMWGDDDKKSVVFGAQSTFVYSDDNAQYGIAFVLVEDGMSNKSWAQSNYLSGENGDFEMSFWYKASSSVYGLEYNHVAVAAWGISSGVKGSVGTTVQAGQPQTFSYNADISSNTLIQDKTKLKAIALLIDQVSGTIVNAAQADIQDYSTGIETIAQAGDSSTKSYYTLDGRRIASPQKGLIIEKDADGKSRKILVK